MNILDPLDGRCPKKKKGGTFSIFYPFYFSNRRFISCKVKCESVVVQIFFVIFFVRYSRFICIDICTSNEEEFGESVMISLEIYSNKEQEINSM